MGVTDDELRDLAQHLTSERFSEVDKLVLDLAVGMSSTPADVPDALRAELRRHFTKSQLAELASAIAWENHRARLNKALGVRPAGFSDGAYCVLPHRAS